MLPYPPPPNEATASFPGSETISRDLTDAESMFSGSSGLLSHTIRRANFLSGDNELIFSQLADSSPLAGREGKARQTNKPTVNRDFIARSSKTGTRVVNPSFSVCHRND